MQTSNGDHHPATAAAPVLRERGELVKRRKVAVACDECRERKRKCDGVRPQCGPCSRRAPPSMCAWSEEKSKYRSYIESLESRIRQLESNNNEDSPSPSAGNGDPKPLQCAFGLATPETLSYRDGPNGSHVQAGGNVNGTNGTYSTTTYSSGAGDGSVHDSEDTSVPIRTVDAIVTSGADIDQAENPSSNYFGPSSTSSFLGLVRLVISKSSRSIDTTAPPRDASNRPVGIPKAAPSLQDLGKTYDSTAFHVPPRREADALVTNYWTWVYTLYPVIHRPTFNERYRALWQQSPSSSLTLDDVLFHCTLNAVFALGAHFQTDIEPSSRTSKSESFFARCQQLLTMDLLGQGTFEMVQALLLMAQYLQSTDKPNHCWNLAGLAIRMAQSVGLHLESMDGPVASENRFDQVEIELRRRVWAGCILLDRVLSMTYGRPLMMHPPMTRQTLVIPSMIDDEFLTHYPSPPGTQPEGLPSVIASYSHTLPLQEILGEILSSFYFVDQSASTFATQSTSIFIADGKQTSESTHASLIGRLRDGDFQDVFRLDAKLSRWYEALPSYLKVEGDDPRAPESEYAFSDASPQSHDSYLPLSAVLSRQANSLKARYLHLRLFLLRPALLIILDRDQHSFTFASNGEIGSCRSILKKRTLYNLADLCIACAEDLLDLIYSHRASEQSTLPAWWLSVFYLHNCAIVMMIALQCPSLHDLRPEVSLKRSWSRCLRCLEGYKQYSEGARRSHRLLQMIDSQIFGEKYDRLHPSRGIVKSLAASPKAESHRSIGSNGSSHGGVNGTNGTNGTTVGHNGIVVPVQSRNNNYGSGYSNTDPFNQYDWSAGMDAITNMPAMADGDFWMGDSGDVSWLSMMPFVPGTTYNSW